VSNAGGERQLPQTARLPPGRDPTDKRFCFFFQKEDFVFFVLF
jgi:hypothetical protein